MPKTAELVWLYVKSHPYIQEALEKGIINYSALARKINKKVKGNQEAVKAALLRISRKLSKRKRDEEKKILAVLKGSSLEVKTKVAAVVSTGKLSIPAIARVKGLSGWTHIIDEENLKKLKRKGVLKIERNLDMIQIETPEEVMKTPGVDAYILSTLAAENINFSHIICCYKDNLLILNESQTMRAFEVLKRIVS
ncbi:MAG: hypothetical protein ISS95_00800 [Candidatus Aenigmarchaeota archaeon]|nr:hypothetical protein [Candidatus Aenigmarchaeota archaeon]